MLESSDSICDQMSIALMLCSIASWLPSIKLFECVKIEMLASGVRCNKETAGDVSDT